MARPSTVYFSDEGSVAIGGNLYTTRCKEFNITGGGRDVELIRTFGKGAIPAERPQELYECSITAVVQDHNFAQLVMGGSDVSDPRLFSGDSYRDRVQVRFTWTDPTDTNGTALRITLHSGFGVSHEVSQSTDKQLEETINFKCLPKDYNYEWTRYATGSPLP